MIIMTTPSVKIKNDEIWFKDFDILFNVDRLTEFVPSSFQTTEEKFNAIMRLALYVSILISIYKRDPSLLLIFPICAVITYFIYKNNEKEKFNNYGEKEDVKPRKEVKPTLNNPFMNTTQADYIENPDKQASPNYYEDTPEAEKLREDVNDKFKHDLYMGVEDAWEKNNSQRQFYTTPNTTIPSDQDKYLQFLYGKKENCKTDANDCKPYEDLRGSPYIFPDNTINPK